MVGTFESPSPPSISESAPRHLRQRLILASSLALALVGGVLLVYAATDGSTSRLLRRSMDRTETTPMPGTEGAFVAGSGPQPEGLIVVESLETGQRHVVTEGGSDPRYVSSGHIVFVRTVTLMAIPFDVARLEVTGPPIAVVEDVMHADRGGNLRLNSAAGQYVAGHHANVDVAQGPGSICRVRTQQIHESHVLPPGKVPLEHAPLTRPGAGISFRGRRRPPARP